MQRQWQQSRSVALQALQGKQVPDVGTATHYHADYVVPKWAYTLAKIDVIGRHIFYRFPGRSGEPRAFAAKWRGAERLPTIDWSRQTASEILPDLPDLEQGDEWVPGLTVAPDPSDRHAENDVGGRLDTTKQWRLRIPDPVNSANSYDAAITSQSEESEGELVASEASPEQTQEQGQ